MYGLIHGAVRSMVEKHAGRDTWQRVAAEAGVGQAELLTMRSYDDDITFAIVNAAASVLEQPPAAFMEELGRYWVLEFAPRDYGALLDHAGPGLFRFLENLNDLHDRITTAFIEFRPPSFSVESIAEGTLVHYRSDRTGLEPFVLGLLQGLAERFGTPMRIDILAAEANAAVFLVTEALHD